MRPFDVTSIRASLPAVSRLAYFNTGAAGPQPLPAVEAHTRVAMEDAAEGPASPQSIDRAIRIAQGSRERVAQLLAADSSEIALGHSTSHGIGLVASGLDWRPGDEIVFNDLEHASGIAPWLHYATRYGIKPVCVRSKNGTVAVDDVAAAITDRTRLVCVSHVTYSTGAILPVKDICRLARERGALTLIDGAQAAGRIQVDAPAIGCDAYAIPGHKWLLGPPGTGALYLGPRAMEQLSPSQVAWGSVQFDDLSSLQYELHEDARRFELASLNPPMFASFNASFDFLADIGWDEIRQRSAQLSDRLIAGLDKSRGVHIHTPQDAESRAGLVTFTPDVADLAAVVDEWYRERRILVRLIAYPRALRASLHVYNTEDEVDRLIDAVRDATS